MRGRRRQPGADPDPQFVPVLLTRTEDDFGARELAESLAFEQSCRIVGRVSDDPGVDYHFRRVYVGLLVEALL